MLLSMVFAESNENTNAFNKYMSPEGGINPMSGTVALQRNLTSLSVGQLSVNFSLKYSGNIYQEVRTPNKEGSSGIVGLGWAFGRARIVCDCKNSAFLDDDTYYLITADGNRYQFFEEKRWRLQLGYDAGVQEKWWLEGHPFWKVERITDELKLPDNDDGEIWRFVKGWKITDSEGIVHIYGDISEEHSLTAPKPNATEYDLAWLTYKDEKGNEKASYGLLENGYGDQPSYYPVAWNISKEEALDGSSLVYEYEQVFEKLSGIFRIKDNGFLKKWKSDISYTKETYLKKVSASNNARIEFVYKEKGEGNFFGEYVDDNGEDEDLSDEGSDMFREKINRKYISEIDIYGPSEKDSDKKIGKITFCYTPLKEGTPYVKRLLSEVKFFDKHLTQIDDERYSYYTEEEDVNTLDADAEAHPLGALFKVKGKDCGWVEYSYVYEPIGKGHVEELPLDTIFGLGVLENGTSYLVGNRGDYLKLYTRILGRWVLTELKEPAETGDKKVPIPAADRVEFGDAGWFMTVNQETDDDETEGTARIIRWNGKNWQLAKKQDFSGEDNTIFRSKLEVFFAGPDYAMMYNVEDKLTLTTFWTKWGQDIKKFTLKNVEDHDKFLRFSARKNHILIKAELDDAFCYDCLRYNIYTFRNGKLEGTKSDDEIDNGNSFILNGSFFAHIGEAKEWDEDSRVEIYNWNGHDWIQQVFHEFDDDDPVDAPAFGSDYFATRYLDKRVLHGFSVENGLWNDEAFHKKVYDWKLIETNEWGAVGSDKFFVMIGSVDGNANRRITIYHHMNGGDWISQQVGSEKGEKEIIAGSDWFAETKSLKKAWLWNGDKWIEEDLSQEGFLDIDPEYTYLDPESSGFKSKMHHAYPLGNNIIAMRNHAEGYTRLIYKLDNSFVKGYGAYLVRSKKILEPVADDTIKYQYSFLPGTNAIDGYAFDESSNTPLMEKMKVEMPDGKGIVERELCEVKKETENIAVGSVCKETQWALDGQSKQWALDGQSKISQTKTYYKRESNGWPDPIYVDQEESKVEIARGIKTVTKNEYSKNNGLLNRTIKRVGKKSTEQKYAFVTDLILASKEERDVVDALKAKNRLNVLAGAYSCIPDCSTGTIVQASANGLSLVDGIETVTSTWKFRPKSKISERVLNNHIRSISLKSAGNANWERQSFNSRYANKRVVETLEGPKNIKMASFYENTEEGKLLGTAVDCGIDEGLMLSGESCNVANWDGCTKDSLVGSAKDAVDLRRTDYKNFGRFSKKYVKLTTVNPLVGTIPNARNAEYTFSAWMQYGSANGTLSLSVNGSVVNTWTTYPESQSADSVGIWKQIEWKGNLNGLSKISLSVNNVSSYVPLQDIRILPSTATSTASFWNYEWDKVEATVNSKGIASYVGFDFIGREVGSYSETENGTVYLSSRMTYADGSCSANPSGSNNLSSLRINSHTQKLPNADGPRSMTYVLSDDYVSIDFETGDENDGVKYNLYALGDNKNKWIAPTCGALCFPSFEFTSQENTWILEVNVAPYESGKYTFTFNHKDYGWQKYGPSEGFADGKSPKFVDDSDSSYVVYQTKVGTLEFSEYNGSKWEPKGDMIVDHVGQFDAFAANGYAYVAYIPNENDDTKKYPKVFRVTKNNVYEKVLSDNALRARDVRMTDNATENPFLIFTKNESIGKEVNPKKTDETRNIYIYNGALYAMKWNSETNAFDYVGYSPEFEYNTVERDDATRTLTFNTGKIVSYRQGIVNDSESVSSDIVLGPNNQPYVAYVASSKYIKEPLVYVKRLYKSWEVPNCTKDIWAGVSQNSEGPLYQGDILSWGDNPYDAVKNVEKIKLAYDGSNFYMAVFYGLEPGITGTVNKSVSLPTHALSVFKGTILSNATINGQYYSPYLKWEPLRDLSLNSTYMAKTVEEEQTRIVYMKQDDDFDFLVRKNKGLYIMFRNADNDDAISVISYKDNRWLSVGEPGFAYPQKIEGSADLGVNTDGNPFVVFKEKKRGLIFRKGGKVTAMHYNAKDRFDLTLDKFESTNADFNASCSFRQYILNYSANLGEANHFVFKATPKRTGDVREIQVVSNKKYKKTITNFTEFSSIPLNKEVNKIEVRVVGTDGSSLTYKFELHRKKKANPNFYTVSSEANTVTTLTPEGEMVVDVFPKSPMEENVVLDLHFGTGWVLELNGNKYEVATPVVLPIQNLPWKGVFVHITDGDTIPVVIDNGFMPDEDPSVFSWYSSSSSSASSSSSSIEGGSSGVSSSSSSGTVLNQDMSDNVPDEIRNLTQAHLFAVNNVSISDFVSVRGDVFTDGNFDIGVSSVVDGDVYSKGNILLRNRAEVGNVFYGGTFESLDGAKYLSKTQWVSQSTPVIPTYTVAPGESDVLVNNNSVQSLVASSYKDFTARTDAVVNFAPGDYHFKNFYTDSRVKLNFSPGTRIWISGDLRIGNNNKLVHSGNSGDLFIYVGSNVSIETNVEMAVVLVAPRSMVSISTGTHVRGYVIGRMVNVQPNVIVE